MYVHQLEISSHATKTNDTQAQRDPDEEGDYMAFEQLMAEAQMKKGKDEKRDDKKDPKKARKEEAYGSQHHHHGFGHKQEPAPT